MLQPRTCCNRNQRGSGFQPKQKIQPKPRPGFNQNQRASTKKMTQPKPKEEKLQKYEKGKNPSPEGEYIITEQVNRKPSTGTDPKSKRSNITSGDGITENLLKKT